MTDFLINTTIFVSPYRLIASGDSGNMTHSTAEAYAVKVGDIVGKYQVLRKAVFA